MHKTRADFLATGLVPTAPGPEQDDCSICFATLIVPVKTPCNHIYCLDCITTWLKGPTHNSCPLCKTELFALPCKEQETRSLGRPSPARQRQIANALRTSNLLSRGPPFLNFGSTEYNLSSLQRGVAQATFALGRGGPPGAGVWVQLDAPGALVRVIGPCALDLQTLSPAFIAMGNLLPALAEAEGRGFDDASKKGWEMVCCALWLELKTMAGRKVDAMVLPALLKMKTRDAVARQRQMSAAAGAEVTPFFEMSGFHGEFLDLLLNSLAFRAWEKQQEDDKREAAARETRRLRKEAREEPKMQSKCCVM